MIYLQQYQNQYDLFLAAFKPSKDGLDEKNKKRMKRRYEILKFQFRVDD